MQDNSNSSYFTNNTCNLCCQGIKAIRDKLDSYTENIVTAGCFSQFFAENINCVASCLPELQVEDSRGHAARLDDIVFALTEEMAVLMREHCLRTGFAGLSNDERLLMDFFETSGHWFLGDGTMVSEYYYVTLPTRVISDMVRGLENRLDKPEPRV